MEANMSIHNILKVISLHQQLSIMLPVRWLAISKKFSAQFWFVVMLKPYKKLLISLIKTNGVMALLFSLNQVQLQENSKMRLKLVKLVLMFLFQFLCQCSLSQEIKNHSMVIWTFTERMVLNSSLNGKL